MEWNEKSFLFFEKENDSDPYSSDFFFLLYEVA